jgi:predicted PurR-regulated permease PerM
MIRQKERIPAGTAVAVAMVIVVMSLAFLYVAEPVLLPLVFSGVLALLLYPLCRFLENNGFPRIPAILLTMFVILCIGTGLILLLSTQIYMFVKELPDIAGKTDSMLNDLEWFLFKNFNIQISAKGGNLVQGSVTKFLDSGVFLLSGTISTFIGIFNLLGLLPIYLFLMLLYRSSFKAFCLHITAPEKHRAVIRILYQVQKVVQNYIIGLLTVMSIVAALTTTSLVIIGVDYAIFFGCFAALLMVVPYLGMIIGTLLPALYALLTKDSGWYAFAVMACFLFIQFIEGNFITPKVTGNRVKINPLAAIVALVAGGYIWGMGGLIIALPMVAILKVILINTPSVKHFGLLLGTEIYESGRKPRQKKSLKKG